MWDVILWDERSWEGGIRLRLSWPALPAHGDCSYRTRANGVSATVRRPTVYGEGVACRARSRAVLHVTMPSLAAGRGGGRLCKLAPSRPSSGLCPDPC